MFKFEFLREPKRNGLEDHLCVCACFTIHTSLVFWKQQENGIFLEIVLWVSYLLVCNPYQNGAGVVLISLATPIKIMG